MAKPIILVVRRMEFNKIHLESTLNKTKKPNINAGLSAFAPHLSPENILRGLYLKSLHFTNLEVNFKIV